MSFSPLHGAPCARRRTALSCAGVLAAVLLASPPSPAQVGQFAVPAPLPFPLDNVQGEWINYETQLIKPIYVAPSGLIVVANEPNGTLEALSPTLQRRASLVLGHGICSIAGPAPVADGADGDSDQLQELWVTVRHQQAIAIIDLASFTLVDWVRPPLNPAGIGYGDADHLGQVVFSDPTLDKAYVSCFNTDQVAVFQRSTHAFLGTIPLGLPHNSMVSDLNTPYSMLVVGKELFVVSHISGNQTMPALGLPQAGPQAPDGFGIRDLNADPNRSQPDFDIMTIDTTADVVVNHKKGVGTINFNIAYHRPMDRLVVANVDLRNGAFIGEGSWPNGQVGINQLTYVDRLAPPAGPHLVVPTETLGGTVGNNVAQPTDVVVDGFGRVVVAGYGSSNLGVFDGAGNWLGSVPTAPGPRGLALFGNTLYVLCRGTNQVQSFAWGATLPGGPANTGSLVDPTPENVKQGRQLFIDSSHSGIGTTSCNTCHVDLRKGGAGWDLSRFHDTGNQFTLQSPPSFWMDRKGVMVTQDLRSLPEVTPYHWRGEQHDLEFFNGAFEGLLQGARLTDDEFAQFKAFVFSARYTPNGEQLLNRSFTSLAMTSFNQDNCFDCHTLPTGTGNDHTVPLTGPASIISLTAQLRALRDKESSRCDVDDTGTLPEISNMTGFGLLHNGRNVDSDDFIDFFFQGLASRKAMLNEFDTGLAPAAVYSELLNASTAGTIRMAYMTSQANAGNCDLAGRGRIFNGTGFQAMGMLWDPSTATFRFDDSTLAPISSATALTMAANGNLTAVLLCTPVWSGERVGLDLDRDGMFDQDERALGLDPDNPDSDGDGLWESYDPNPLAPSAPPAGPVNVSNIQVHYVTTNSVKVTWETDTFSPTRLVYGLTAAYGSSDGDPFPLSLAPNTSLLWKRKHQAFLRVLQDGALYHFAVVTQGQNGVISQTPDQQVLVNADNLSPNMRVQVQALTQVGAAPNITWVATVQVTDNAGNPVVGASLGGLFVHFVGGGPVNQTLVGPVTTGAGGIANVVTTFTGQSPGDLSRFTIPQLLDLGGGVMVLPVAGGGAGTFFWPESDPTSLETTVQ